jgi:hypothetical protein
MLNVYIIGSSVSDPKYPQMPTKQNVELFFSELQRPITLHFIDPQHDQNKNDGPFFEAYQTIQSDNCKIRVWAHEFSFETFYDVFQPEEKSDMFFVDFANYARSEYEFMLRMGDSNRRFYCPGCMGEQLDLLQVYKNTPMCYRLTSADPVPSYLNRKYRENVLDHLNTLINYVRLLTLPSPPAWLLNSLPPGFYCLEKRQHLIDSAHDLLKHFFSVNGLFYGSIPLNDLYKTASRLLLL